MKPARCPNSKLAAKILRLPAGSCSLSVVLAAGLAGCRAGSAPETKVLPPVVVTESRRMTLPIIVHPIGTTRAIEEVTIRARVRGFLTEKHFEYGTNVKKNELLLVIDEKPFKVLLDEAIAQRESADASLKKAIASKGPEVAKAQLALSQAQARLDEIEERRSHNLLVRKAASQEDYDRAEAQKRKSQAQVEADQASLSQAVADYDIGILSARASVHNARAAVDDAEINLSYCRMYAPISGRIGELKVKVGNLVGDAGQTELVTIEQLDPMGLDLHPSARYLPSATALLAAGVEVDLSVEGARRHPHRGKATFIDNRVDATTSTFLLRAEVANPDGSVLPGQYIRATVIIGNYQDAVVVPDQAVVQGLDGYRVYVVDATNKVQINKVSPVVEYEGLRVLEDGLEAGQRIIVDGIQLVRADQFVDPTVVPLEQFIRPDVEPQNIDPRFDSRVSRITGADSNDVKGSPGVEKSNPHGKDSIPSSQKPADSKANPPGRDSIPSSEKPADSKGNPALRATKPAANPAR
jgi:membrane fusion protein, multidrug efflux system